MKMNHIFVHWNKDTPTAHVEMEVDGLGTVKIEHALSADLIARIIAESEVALRQRLGQVCKDTDNGIADGTNRTTSGAIGQP
jgi:hypothetical protein